MIIQFSKVVSSSLAFCLRDPLRPHLQRQPPLRSDTDGSLFTLCLIYSIFNFAGHLYFEKVDTLKMPFFKGCPTAMDQGASTGEYWLSMPL